MRLTFNWTAFLAWTLSRLALAEDMDTAIVKAMRDGSDLATYLSRPDIRAPKWNVTKHHPDRISPGYWFVSPYTRWASRPLPIEFEPAQVGPCIYDGDGELIWTGATLDRNRNAQDFRPYMVGNETRFSYVLAPLFLAGLENSTGVFVTMDTSYQKLQSIVPATDVNGHEFKIIEDGRSALIVASHVKHLDPTGPEDGAGHYGHYVDDCVAEMNMGTGEKEFEWCGLEHGIVPEDTYESPPAESHDWDYLHINSVDKFANGDLLFSARYTSTVYRVSRADNSIVWRLGGKHSNFTSDFGFSGQHNARIVSENATTTIITLLDNASLEEGRNRQTANVSSAKMIALHTSEETMRAQLLRQWDRPDGLLTRKRGNVDILPGGNLWVAWSEQAYTTEETMDGEVLLEAQFSSPRFSTYRAYKSSFVGYPLQPPDIKVLQHTTGDDNIMAAYVSWNGATEVASWRFMGCRSGNDTVIEIATVAKTGFETSITVSGLWSNVSAFALDAHGQILSVSPTVAVVLTKTSLTLGAFAGLKDKITTTLSPIVLSSNASLVVAVITCTLLFQGVLIAGFFIHRRIATTSQSDPWIPDQDGAQTKEVDVPLLKWELDRSTARN